MRTLEKRKDLKTIVYYNLIKMRKNEKFPLKSILNDQLQFQFILFNVFQASESLKQKLKAYSSSKSKFFKLKKKLRIESSVSQPLDEKPNDRSFLCSNQDKVEQFGDLNQSKETCSI